MIRTTLDQDTRDELRRLRRSERSPRVRDRIEMVGLSDSGWSAPRIAQHLGYNPQTVRDLLRAFLARGTAALYPSRGGPAPDAQRFEQVASALRELLGRPRTWTGPQLSRALAERGITLGARQVRRYLRRMGAKYRRTAQTLRHKQDPAKAERAARVVDNLEARAAAGRLKLYYLDECGFSPTQPVGSSWALPGQRKLVEYEAPQGRRVNVLAAYRPHGPTPRLDVFTAERTWVGYDFLAFLRSLPWAPVPRVVVLDNGPLHTSHLVREARRGLAGKGIYLYYLPSYSPEFNRIEGVFRQVKYQEMPQRSYTQRSQLREAVERGFRNYGRTLRPKTREPLRPAA
ncbi:MAG: IS630 family transposase [Isosphaeraceae bacterium]